MDKRFLFLAVVFASIGLGTAFGRWPELRVVQVLLPFAAGLAAGLLLHKALGMRIAL